MTCMTESALYRSPVFRALQVCYQLLKLFYNFRTPLLYGENPSDLLYSHLSRIVESFYTQL